MHIVKRACRVQRRNEAPATEEETAPKTHCHRESAAFGRTCHAKVTGGTSAATFHLPRLELAARPASWRAAHQPGGSDGSGNTKPSCPSASSSGTLCVNRRAQVQSFRRTSSGFGEQGLSSARAATPNPSIERTTTSLALPVAPVHCSPSRAKPAAAAHVKLQGLPRLSSKTWP